MQPIHIDATERSPEVDFDFAAGRLRMRGESYPEDAASFYGPLMQALRSHLTSNPAAEIVFDLEMEYFNSSSAKALMNIFQLLENGAAAGARVVVNWRFQPDDDAMQEFGEDFAEDFTHATFNLCPVAAT